MSQTLQSVEYLHTELKNVTMYLELSQHISVLSNIYYGLLTKIDKMFKRSWVIPLSYLSALKKVYAQYEVQKQAITLPFIVEPIDF